MLFFADIIRIKILFATYIRYRLFSLGVSQRVRNHNKLVYRIEACLVLADLKLKVTLPRALKSENFAKYFLREIFRKIFLSKNEDLEPREIRETDSSKLIWIFEGFKVIA